MHALRAANRGYGDSLRDRSTRSEILVRVQLVIPGAGSAVVGRSNWGDGRIVASRGERLAPCPERWRGIALLKARLGRTLAKAGPHVAASRHRIGEPLPWKLSKLSP
jgi:hypothetical protein